MRKIFLFLSFLIFVTLACSSLAPQAVPTTAPTPVPATPTQIPLTEADVPRISVAEAKTALDSHAAIILDVRSAESYAQSHIAGSLSLPLALIEKDPANLDLKKDRWIITYCT